jgi:hypothetical protein
MVSSFVWSTCGPLNRWAPSAASSAEQVPSWRGFIPGVFIPRLEKAAENGDFMGISWEYHWKTGFIIIYS